MLNAQLDSRLCQAQAKGRQGDPPPAGTPGPRRGTPGPPKAFRYLALELIIEF